MPLDSFEIHLFINQSNFLSLTGDRGRISADFDRPKRREPFH